MGSRMPWPAGGWGQGRGSGCEHPADPDVHDGMGCSLAVVLTSCSAHSPAKHHPAATRHLHPLNAPVCGYTNPAPGRSGHAKAFLKEVPCMGE